MFDKEMKDLEVDYVYSIIIRNAENIDYVLVSRIIAIGDDGVITFHDFQEIFNRTDPTNDGDTWTLNVPKLTSEQINEYIFIKMGYKDQYAEYLL